MSNLKPDDPLDSAYMLKRRVALDRHHRARRIGGYPRMPTEWEAMLNEAGIIMSREQRDLTSMLAKDPIPSQRREQKLISGTMVGVEARDVLGIEAHVSDLDSVILDLERALRIAREKEMRLEFEIEARVQEAIATRLDELADLKPYDPESMRLAAIEIRHRGWK